MTALINSKSPLVMVGLGVLFCLIGGILGGSGSEGGAIALYALGIGLLAGSVYMILLLRRKVDEYSSSGGGRKRNKARDNGVYALTEYEDKVPVAFFLGGIITLIGAAIMLAGASSGGNATYFVVTAVFGALQLIMGFALPKMLPERDDALHRIRERGGTSRASRSTMSTGSRGSASTGRRHGSSNATGAGQAKPVFIGSNVMFLLGLVLLAAQVGTAATICMLLGIGGLVVSAVMFRRENSGNEEEEAEEMMSEYSSELSRMSSSVDSAYSSGISSLDGKISVTEATKKRNGGYDPRLTYMSAFQTKARSGAMYSSMSGFQTRSTDRRMTKRQRKRMEEMTRAEKQEAWEASMGNHKPYFIYGLSAVQAAFLLVELVINGGPQPISLSANGAKSVEEVPNFWIGPHAKTLCKMGAKHAFKIRDDEEWWRFLTPVLLHNGVLHLLMNGWFQLKVASLLERAYGGYRIAIIYVFAGIGGNMISSIFLPLSLTAGASSSLFGLLGVLFIDLLQNWWNLEDPHSDMKNMCTQMAGAVLMGLMPGIDNFAHLGGMITGIMAGIIFLPTVTFGRQHAKWKSGLVCWAIPMLGIFLIVLIYVFYSEKDAAGFCKACYGLNCLSAVFGEQCSMANVDVEQFKDLC